MLDHIRKGREKDWNLKDLQDWASMYHQQVREYVIEFWSSLIQGKFIDLGTLTWNI